MQKINSTTYKWALKNNRLYYDLNFFQYKSEKETHASFHSSFLYLTAIEHLNFNNDINRDLDLFREFNRKDLNIWGIRKEKNQYTIEYYFFYPKKFRENSIENLKPFLSNYNPNIENISIPKDAYLISINPEVSHVSTLEYYLPEINPGDKLFELPDLGFYFRLKDPILFSTLVDLSNNQKHIKNTYYSYYNIGELAKINLKLISFAKELYPNENSHVSLEYLNLPYIFNENKLIHPSAIKIKDTNIIGLYFSGISIHSFFEFLVANQYEESYILELEKNKKYLDHLKFDVGIDFKIENSEFTIVKSAFWGSL